MRRVVVGVVVLLNCLLLSHASLLHGGARVGMGKLKKTKTSVVAAGIRATSTNDALHCTYTA